MRILIVDDHNLVRDGIKSLLESAGHFVIGECGNGEDGVLEAMRLQPDVVLMDISMPGMNGLDALSLIKNQAPHIQVVMLTVSEDLNTLQEAMQKGASGYMLKSTRSEEFLENLQSIERGELALNRSSASQLIYSLMKSECDCEKKEQNLTDRECEILCLVAAGYSNKDIGQKLSVSENTIKYHIKKILNKLNVHNRTEAVAYAMQTKVI